jgi:hypothetical protein
MLGLDPGLRRETLRLYLDRLWKMLASLAPTP